MTTKKELMKSDYYLKEQDELSNVKLDPNIILNEPYLKYLPYCTDALHEPYRFLHEIDDFYPYVNSYYPYTEDVDALERVNHLLGSEHSLTRSNSSSSTIFKHSKFPYSEKDAHTEYLLSTPLSFIVIGKPEIGEKELAKKIADHWRCVYIEPETLIEQEVQSRSKAGQCIEFNLRCGRAIGIDVILKLVEKRIKSESALHRGVIICGLPVIPNDLYTEDPVSTSLAVFTAKEIFQEALNTTYYLTHSLDDTQTYIASRTISEDEWKESEESQAEDANHIPTKNKRVSYFDVDVGDDVDLDFLSKISTNYETQLKFLFDLLKIPLLIIHMICCTEDVIEKRNKCRFSVYSKCEVQVESHQLSGGLNQYVLNDYINKRHLIRSPRNFPANVCSQLDNYHSTAIKYIERRILLHDPQYFIKVDARNNIDDMFRVIQRKLLTLPHHKMALPARFITSNLEIDQGEDKNETEVSSKLNYNQFYKLYSTQNAPGAFKWTWSDWGTKCPVSMKEGYCTQGDITCAVHFMNKMFFLANETAVWKFCRNPRPYLIAPYPKCLCKIFIFGPQASGKTTVAKCLSYLYDGTVLRPKEVFKNIIEQQQGEEREKIRQAAIDEAMALLTKQRGEEAEKLEEERAQAIKDWVAEIVSMIEKLLILLEDFDKEQTIKKFEISSFPMAMERTSMAEIETETTIAIRKIKDFFEHERIPFSKDVKMWEQFLSDKKKLLRFLPDRLKKKFKPVPVNRNDSFVQTFADEAVANVQLHFDISSDNLVKMFKEMINKSNMENLRKCFNIGGWIMDDMMSDLKLLEELSFEYIADDIILLWDSSSDFEFLVNRYEHFNLENFKDFQGLFSSLGKTDVMFPACSDFSTESSTVRIVRSIVSEIIDTEEIYASNTDVPTRGDVYRQEVKTFYKKWENVKTFLHKIGKEPIVIDVANKTFPQLLEEVINTFDNIYNVGAREFTQEDRAEEVRNLTTFSPMSAVQTEDHPDHHFDEYRLYGDTSHYCPVTLHEKSVLWRGKEHFTAIFRSRIYLMASKEDHERFLKSPDMFAAGNSPKKLPPPRICVIGIPGIGKTKIAQEISNNYGLVYFSFLNTIKKSYNILFENSFFQILNSDAINSSVYGYLHEGQPLPESFYSDNLSKIWFEGEMKNVGFVFDDFPKREADIAMMIKYKLIPDVILLLTSQERPLKTSMVEKLCQQWQQKEGIGDYSESRKAAIAKSEEQRKKRFQELLNERREHRYTQKRQPKDIENNAEPPDVEPVSDASQVSFNSVEEQKDIDEINKILHEELPEQDTHVATETFEEAKARIEGGVSKMFKYDSRAIRTITKECVPNNIPLETIPVDFGLPDRTLRKAFYLLDSIKNRTASFFERCYDVSNQLVESLLNEGYFFLSRFGRLCPVQYKAKTNPFHMYSMGMEKDEIHPVTHRSFIYFVHGWENLKKFKEDPLFYVNVENIEFTSIPFLMAVTGPPKCGKSLLARRISEDFGLKVVTRGQAIRNVLSKFPECSLTYQMENLLRKGWEVTDEIVVKAVEASCLDGDGIVQGVVFDGFPNTISEARHLSYAGLIPNLIIDLDATKDETIERLQICLTRENLPRYSIKFLDHLLKEWNLTAEEFRTWFDREYQVTTKLPISTSIWSIHNETTKFVLSVFFEIKHYYVNISKGWPLRLANLKVSPLEFLERQSKYKTFCPCCLHFFNELVDGGNTPDRTGVIQYRKYFYWLCGDHIEQFLSSPDSYLSPYCKHRLPQELPKPVIDLQKIPLNVAEDGLCVVCYIEFRNLEKGCLTYAVEYCGKVFLFDTLKCLKIFSRNPHKWNFKINFKYAENYTSVNYKNLPVLGMLEQYVAIPIIESLKFIVRRRPLIPGLSVTSSALIGIGIFLKVHHAKLPSKYRELYVEAAKLFRERRKKLISSLDRMKTSINPYLYYQESMPDFKMPASICSEHSENDRNYPVDVADY